MYLNTIYRKQTQCKCCANIAYLYDVCDFNKSCEEAKKKYLPLSGIPIYYYKCLECGFVFTNAFDEWDMNEFKEHIYNEQYIDVDPDYVERRPSGSANIIHNLFSQSKETLKIIDYGGGNGIFEKRLFQFGFKNVKTYDPFYPKFSEKPSGKFNLLTSFEVIEHVPNPYETFEEMFSLLDLENGLIVFSTLIQPKDIDNMKTRWWYISPRNGHISIHSAKSIHKLLNKLKLNFASANTNLHFAFKTIPSFAKHIFRIN